MDSHALRNALPLLAALLALALASVASAAPPVPPIVTNGDFEETTVDPWVLGNGTGELAGPTDWVAASGDQSVHLADGAWVYQWLSTTAGKRYDLTFSYAGNPRVDPTKTGCDGQSVKEFTVYWGDTVAGAFAADTTGRSASGMGWQTVHTLVDAQFDMTPLQFRNHLDPGCGIAIDDVAVSAPTAGQTGVHLTPGNPTVVTGEQLLLTATVVGPSAVVVPTGTVQFSIDGTAIGDPVAVVDGTARTSLDALDLGTHYAEADFTPTDGTFTSSSASQRVSAVRANTSTSVTLDQSYVPAGTVVTATASVGVYAPGAGTPTGTIQFSDDFGALGDPVPLESDGTAQIAIGGEVGYHSVYASYSGDDGFAASGSSAAFTVYEPTEPAEPPTTRIATTTAVVGSASLVPPGGAYSATATVSPSTPSDALLDGTIQFSVAGTPHGGPIALDANRTATTQLVAPTGVTRHSVRATYSGNESFAGSRGTLFQRIGVPAPPPVPRPGPVRRDITPATVTLASVRARLARALRKGLRVRLACNEACTAAMRLSITQRDARRLGMKASFATLRVARGRTTAQSAAAHEVQLVFSRPFRSRLAKARRLRLRLVANVVDAAGNRTIATRAVTLKP
jgi:hypothetical protein